MSKFAVGDTVKIKRSGMEAEIVELHATDPERVVCGWINDAGELWEVLFHVDALDLVKAKETEPEKPAKKPGKKREAMA